MTTEDSTENPGTKLDMAATLLGTMPPFDMIDCKAGKLLLGTVGSEEGITKLVKTLVTAL